MPRRTSLIEALILAGILACSTIASAEEPSTVRGPADETELTRLEKTWNEAHLNGNADALAKIWDDDLSVIVPKMRLITKPDALAMLRSSRFKFTRYETSDLSMHFYGDTVVVTGRLQRTRKIGEREMQDDWHFSKVYIRRAKEWRVVLWQASEEPAQESAPSPSQK